VCRLLLIFWWRIDWELEISKRFQQPLFSESNEFPDAETIHKRMVPICYQEGLVGGCNSACSDLMTVAAETFLKEQLSDMMRRVRSNGQNFVKTAQHRKMIRKEEDAYDRGEVQKNAYGLLPIEVEIESRRKPFNREDLRLAALMGNSYLAQSRIIHERVINAPFVEEEYSEEDEMDLNDAEKGKHAVNGTMINGFHRSTGEYLASEESDWGWNGGGGNDRGALDGEFDDVLAIG
jgi:transcriptional coactivator HFI1/ADA1